MSSKVKRLLTGDSDILGSLESVADNKHFARPRPVGLNSNGVDHNAALVAFCVLWFTEAVHVAFVNILNLHTTIIITPFVHINYSEV